MSRVEKVLNSSSISWGASSVAIIAAVVHVLPENARETFCDHNLYSVNFQRPWRMLAA